MKKPWRKIRSIKDKSNIIRKVCCSILILELAFFVREYGGSWIVLDKQEDIWVETGADEEESLEHSYGIRIRLKEGKLEFYRKEEVKNIY